MHLRTLETFLRGKSNILRRWYHISVHVRLLSPTSAVKLHGDSRVTGGRGGGGAGVYFVWRGELEYEAPGRAVSNQLGKDLSDCVLQCVRDAAERVREDALAQVLRRDEHPVYTLAGARQAESTLAWVQQKRNSQVKLINAVCTFYVSLC